MSILFVQVVFIFLVSNVYADDYCNESFVSNLLISFEEEDGFKACHLKSIKYSHSSSSLELIELLTSLKEAYINFITNNNESGHTSAARVADIDLVSPVILIQLGEGIDPGVDGGLEKLSDWAVDVISSIKTQKIAIMSLNQHSGSNDERQSRCEIKYQWRKLHASRNQLLNCINNLKNAELEVTNEDVGGEE